MEPVDRDQPELHLEELAEYLAGHADAHARDGVETWARTDAERARELDILREAWNALSATPVVLEDVDSRRAWNQVIGRITEQEWASTRTVSSRHDLHVRQPRPRWGIWLGAAAVIVATVFAIRPWSSHVSTSARGLTYTSAVGQVATVTLRDGSRVTLAPQTTLTMVDETERTVTVRGEAYFDVRSAERSPFTVVTMNGATTRVLGTTFDVAQYPGDRTARIIVQSGKVRTTSPSGGAVTLVPGMIARVGDSVTIQRTGGAGYTEWLGGQLVFDQAPVQEVLETLSHWYGVRFDLTDTTLAHDRLSAKFSARSQVDALAILSEVLHVRTAIHRINDTTVISLRAGEEPASSHAPSVREGRDKFSITKEGGQ